MPNIVFCTEGTAGYSDGGYDKNEASFLTEAVRNKQWTYRHVLRKQGLAPRPTFGRSCPPWMKQTEIKLRHHFLMI